VVGGYSPLPWRDDYEESGTHFKTDKLQQAFIFNYTSKEKYKLVKTTNNKAIVGCKYLGPTFGGGYDFSIGNFANKNTPPLVIFPSVSLRKFWSLGPINLPKNHSLESATMRNCFSSNNGRCLKSASRNKRNIRT
jgi:hypothetical protein